MQDSQMRRTTVLDIEDPEAIIKEIKTIASLAYPHFDDGPLEQAYGDLIRLFHGEYPGYRQSNVNYHNLNHTLAVTLAVTRLMHGAVETGCLLTQKEFNIGMISGLMHDTGYIQRSDDIEGTGAKYTLTHISRSIEFVRLYYRNNPIFRKDIKLFRDILRCTGFSTDIAQIRFTNDNVRLLGQMLGTADLMGQMADRHYLEKLLDLYYEFVEAGITTFTSQLDLLEKTRGFYQMTLKRFSEELGNVHHFARHHFRKHINVDEDLYMRRIESNMTYLDFVLTHHPDDFRRYLRRSL